MTTVEVKNPDLSRVDEIGFVDLMPGGGKGCCGLVQRFGHRVVREVGSARKRVTLMRKHVT